MTLTASPPQVAAPRGFLRSTIGRKVVMALTGLVLVGFIIAHMAGNLQMFLPNGPEAMRDYALFLRSLLHGTGIWIMRGTLIIAAILHVWAAVSLTLENRAARPTRYRDWEPRASTIYSRTMRWTGVALLIYVVYHLLQITFGTIHPDFIELQPYHNLVVAFRVRTVAWAYVVAMILLGWHLNHGIWSMLRTLGVSHPAQVRLTHVLSIAIAVIVVLGYISIPIAVQLGYLR